MAKIRVIEDEELIRDNIVELLETEIFEEYGYDSTYKEISKNLNVPAKCVDNALTRIRKKATDVYTVYKDANYKFEGSLYKEEIIVIEEYIQSKDKKNE